MEVEYRKDLHHNYMVITEDKGIQTEPYCVKLLEQQHIEGILLMEQRQVDEKHLFYYDITGMQSMKNLLDKSSLSFERLKLIMNGILHTMETAYEFLLPEDDFVLKPEFIYLDVVSYIPVLCFLSGYQSDMKEQLNYLLEYLMNKVDYNDREAVLLVYQLYAASREESYTAFHLHEVLTRQLQPQLLAPEKKEIEDETVPSRFHLKEKPLLSEEKLILEKIPVMLEKQEREAEEFYYPVSAYLFTALCVVIGILVIILGYTTGILYNSYGERIDYSKLCALIMIVLCLEGYLLRKIWSKKNKIARIVTKSEYIDPRIEPDYTGIRLGRIKPIRTDYLQEEYSSTEDQGNIVTNTVYSQKEMEKINPTQGEINPTCLLSDLCKDSGVVKLYLKPRAESGYQSIPLLEFPFFIGKLKSEVDYCLDQNVISRYHAKITKEDGKYYITDLNSTNGTYLNGGMLQTYEKKEILLGDEIAFANISYQLIQAT